VHDVLCFGFATHDAARKPEHDGPVAIVQLRERARVTIGHGAKEGLVADSV